jgi:hypothetical protein
MFGKQFTALQHTEKAGDLQFLSLIIDEMVFLTRDCLFGLNLRLQREHV